MNPTFSNMSYHSVDSLSPAPSPYYNHEFVDNRYNHKPALQSGVHESIPMEQIQSSEYIQSMGHGTGHDVAQWKPGFWRQLPVLSILAMMVVLACTFRVAFLDVGYLFLT